MHIFLFLFIGATSAAHIEVISTSWCPSCTSFLRTVGQLYKSYVKPGSKVKFSYYLESYCEKNTPNLSCASDKSALEKCVINSFGNNPKEFLPVLPSCQDNAFKNFEAALKCIANTNEAKARKINIESLKKCGTTLEGRKLLGNIYQAQQNASKGITHYLWVVVDGSPIEWGKIYNEVVVALQN